jgi:hypothetical protein
MDDAEEEEDFENLDPILFQQGDFAKQKQLRIGLKKETWHWEGRVDEEQDLVK